MIQINLEDKASIDSAKAKMRSGVNLAFNKLDLDGNGEIERCEIEQLASQGIGLTEDEIN